MGVEYVAQGDLRKALRELTSALELNPDYGRAHLALGLVYHGMREYDRALHHYQQALESPPCRSVAFNNMGTLLVDMERYDDAIAAFGEALQDILYPTPAHAEGNMGWAYYKKGDVERSIVLLQGAVASQPNFCRGYGWLAQIGHETERHAVVEQAHRRYLRYCMQDAAVAAEIPALFRAQMDYFLGSALVVQGRKDEAGPLLAHCSSIDGGLGDRCRARMVEVRAP
jgi:type IV pilus biogenesis/stability protein PilW